MNKQSMCLFKPGNVHGNVNLHSRGSGSAVDFGLYADHFRDAAFYLVGKIEESAGYSDLDACPIAFLYRHALELYFKSIILSGVDILRLNRDSFTDLYNLVDPANRNNIFTIHTLGKLFDHVGVILDRIWGPWPIEDSIPTLDEAKKIIKDLDNVDEKSFSFRYPINKDGSVCEPRKIMFNIVDFSRKLQKFCEFLENCYSGLSDVYQNFCESLLEQQSY